MKKKLNEMALNAKAIGGKANINGHVYKLEVDKGFLGWTSVNIDNITLNASDIFYDFKNNLITVEQDNILFKADGNNFKPIYIY